MVIQTQGPEKTPRALWKVHQPNLSILGVGDLLRRQEHRKSSQVKDLRPMEVDDEIEFRRRLGGEEDRLMLPTGRSPQWHATT